MTARLSRTLTLTVAAAFSLSLIGPAAAQQAGRQKAARKKAAQQTPRKKSPAMEPIKDDPDLPRVLLIGDSISVGYTMPTRKMLDGKANLHRALENCGPTEKGVTSLKKWLSEGKWDVIHFNFGLHDLKTMPKTEKVQVPLDDYEKNLKTIVEQLKGTKASLIWASTTPVQDEKTSAKAKRTNKNVEAYNAAAAKIMRAEGITINDLYKTAMDGPLADIQNKDGVHFSQRGSRMLAKQVSAAVTKALTGKAASGGS